MVNCVKASVESTCHNASRLPAILTVCINGFCKVLEQFITEIVTILQTSILAIGRQQVIHATRQVVESLGWRQCERSGIAAPFQHQGLQLRVQRAFPKFRVYGLSFPEA
ncbi:MAG: hypothetical protein KBT20_06445 [Bacteroidales bacterium]|nr:hypothetical protein [Candidatus Liminaster caballi]